jgi:hypothetical protein
MFKCGHCGFEINVSVCTYPLLLVVSACGSDSADTTTNVAGIKHQATDE